MLIQLKQTVTFSGASTLKSIILPRVGAGFNALSFRDLQLSVLKRDSGFGDIVIAAGKAGSKAGFIYDNTVNAIGWTVVTDGWVDEQRYFNTGNVIAGSGAELVVETLAEAESGGIIIVSAVLEEVNLSQATETIMARNRGWV